MDKTIAPLICISIAQPDARSVIQAAEGVPADVVEVRLDAMQQPEISPIRAAITRPLLCTCRPRWEGGSYDGDEETRIGLLAEAVEQGADYVDIELAAREEFRERLRRACATTQCELIVSHHDFDATPDARTLETILAAQMAAGADIGKIVTTARNPVDVARILALQAAAADGEYGCAPFAWAELPHQPGGLSASGRIHELCGSGSGSYRGPGTDRRPGHAPHHGLTESGRLTVPSGKNPLPGQGRAPASTLLQGNPIHPKSCTSAHAPY